LVSLRLFECSLTIPLLVSLPDFIISLLISLLIHGPLNVALLVTLLTLHFFLMLVAYLSPIEFGSSLSAPLCFFALTVASCEGWS
jgi:hypothetical protein